MNRARACLSPFRYRLTAGAPEESFRGVNAVVAPMFSASAKFEGTIGVFGLIEAIGQALAKKNVDAVRRAAKRFFDALEWKQ